MCLSSRRWLRQAKPSADGLGKSHVHSMHGHGTFTSTSGGWSFTGTLAGGRPVAGVLTEPGGRRFDVKYAGDCALMQNNPTPSSKVAKRQVLGDLQPPRPLPVSHGVI